MTESLRILYPALLGFLEPLRAEGGSIKHSFVGDDLRFQAALCLLLVLLHLYPGGRCPSGANPSSI